MHGSARRLMRKHVMTIIKIDKSESAERVLHFIGSNFFSGQRLQKFIQSHLSSLSSVPQITLDHLTISRNKNMELYAFVDADNNVLGGMTLNYYLWERRAQQSYFSFVYNPQGKIEKVFVEPFNQLLSRYINQVESIQIAVELGYFTVDETVRGQGIGRQLFEHFINRITKNPITERLAFTIVMGKYSKTPFGDALMKHLFRNGTELDSQPVVLEAVLSELGQPKDIFAPDTGAIPTARLAEKYGFDAVGYGHYLGQVWVKRI